MKADLPTSFESTREVRLAETWREARRRPWTAAFVAGSGAVAGVLCTWLRASLVTGTGSRSFDVGPLEFASLFSWTTLAAVLICAAACLLLWLVYCAVRLSLGASPLGRVLVLDALSFLLMPSAGFLAAMRSDVHAPRCWSTVTACFVAMLAWKVGWLVRDLLHTTPPPRARILFGLAFAVYMGLALPDTYKAPTGDEVSYLLMAQSLLADGDLDLHNQLEERQYASFFRGELPVGTFLKQRGTKENPQVYSQHAIGTSLLIAPGWWLGGRLGVHVILCLVAAAGVTVTYVTIRSVLGDGKGAVRGALALALLPPYFPYANAIFPEAPGALLMSLGLAAIIVPRRRRIWWLMAAACCCALLPWFSFRFVPICAVLFGGVLWASRWTPSGTPAVALGRTVATALLAGLPNLASAAGLWLYIRGAHGAAAATGGYQLSGIGWNTIPSVALGLWFDQGSGLFAYGPIWALAPAGAVLLWQRARRATALASAVVVAQAAFLSLNIQLWCGMWSPASRLMVVMMPAMALLAAGVMDRRLTRWGSRLCLAVAVWSAAMSLLMANPKLQLHKCAPSGEMLAETGGGSLLFRKLRPVGRLFPWMHAPTRGDMVLALGYLAAAVAGTIFLVRSARRTHPVAKARHAPDTAGRIPRSDCRRSPRRHGDEGAGRAP